jgi:hypothetical protein
MYGNDIFIVTRCFSDPATMFERLKDFAEEYKKKKD